jgi:hypothetical protein
MHREVTVRSGRRKVCYALERPTYLPYALVTMLFQVYTYWSAHSIGIGIGIAFTLLRQTTYYSLSHPGRALFRVDVEGKGGREGGRRDEMRRDEVRRHSRQGDEQESGRGCRLTR